MISVPAEKVEAMVRLTLPHYGEDGHYMKCSEDFGCDGNCGDCPELDQLVERLAAYEDTGLTPKQAADATPVVYGRWRFCGEDRWNDAYVCSECGKIAMDNSNYCPNCGAEMGGKRRSK